MDTGDTTYRSANPASRPPSSGSREDTPLFTEIPYTPSRRTPPSGRPASSSGSSGPSRSGEWSSPYGGRPYSQPRSRSSAPSGETQRPQNRATPVYTELSWDDLRRGTDFNSIGRAPTPAAPPPPPEPERRSATPYFGGFEQERGSYFSSDQPYHTNGGQEKRREIRFVAPTRPAARQRAVRTGSAVPQPRTTAPRQNTRPTRPAAPSSGRTSTAGSRRSSRPSRGRGIPPLYLMGGFILLALVIFGLSRLGGNNTSPNTNRPVTPAVIGTAEPTDALPEDSLIAAESSPEATPDMTPTPSPEPSPTPSGPKAQQLGDLIVPADWGPVVPERRREVYDSYFDKSCMIGNSLVDGFFMWSGMTNIRYIYSTGATVGGAIGGLDLAPLTLNPNGYYTDIYLMFGLNEIGIDVNSFVQSYKKLVDFIREHQSSANIYIISVTPVIKRVDEDPNEAQSMERIRNFNAALKEFCVDQNCWYLDIYSMLLDDEGYLSEDYAFMEDGKHFEKSGYVAWANYMKTHYVDSGLLTE